MSTKNTHTTAEPNKRATFTCAHDSCKNHHMHLARTQRMHSANTPWGDLVRHTGGDGLDFAHENVPMRVLAICVRDVTVVEDHINRPRIHQCREPLHRRVTVARIPHVANLYMAPTLLQHTSVRYIRECIRSVANPTTTICSHYFSRVPSL